MKKALIIDPAVVYRLAGLTKDQRARCLLALIELTETFGQPHVHSGLGIRKLTTSTFECRGILALRFLFHNRPNDLYVSFLGDHNEVQAALKTRKFD